MACSKPEGPKLVCASRALLDGGLVYSTRSVTAGGLDN